jgi:hypothetical protein
MSDMGPLTRRPPTGALVALLAVLALGPLGVVALGRAPSRAQGPVAPDARPSALARAGGCRLIQYSRLRTTSPTTGGVVTNERVRPAAMRSYVGEPAPGDRPALHALMHGGVLVQYRPDLAPADAARLANLARSPRERTLVYQGRSPLPAPVVATAYMAMLTCDGAGPRALKALAAFRDQRRDFGMGI